MLRRVLGYYLAPDGAPSGGAPAAAPATPTTPEPQAAEVVDPYVKEIMDSMGKVLPPEVKEVDVPFAPSPTLGEIAAAEAKKAAEAAKATDPAAAAQPAAAAAPATPTPPATPAPKVVKKKPEAAPAPAATPPAAQPAAPPTPPPPAEPVVDPVKAKADADYIASLTPEQQDEIEAVRFADANGKPGLLDKTLAYYRKLDKFIEDNPDESEDGKALAKFIEENRPWSKADRRKAERSMIAAQARDEAIKTLQPTVQAQRAEILEMKAKPVIASTLQTVESILSATPEKLANETDEQYQQRTANEPVAIDNRVATRIREAGLEQAKKEFPIEAPVVQGTLAAVEAWTKMSMGTMAYNPNDPLHPWLVAFVNRQAKDMAAMPESVRVQNGKAFLLPHEYMAAQAKDPAAAAKYWTFDDAEHPGMVAELLANNARLTVTQQIRALENAGFKREAKTVSAKVQNGGQPAAAQPAAGQAQGTTAPRAGAGGIPGAADADAGRSSASQFIDSLVPGASKDLGLA